MSDPQSESTPLSQLSVGAEVYVAGDYGSTGAILPIERVTATQIVVGGCRYRRNSGSQVGADPWRGGSIAIVTEHHRTEVRRKKALDALRRLAPLVDARVKISTENIEAAVKLLTPPTDAR